MNSFQVFVRAQFYILFVRGMWSKKTQAESRISSFSGDLNDGFRDSTCECVSSCLVAFTLHEPGNLEKGHRMVVVLYLTG